MLIKHPRAFSCENVASEMRFRISHRGTERRRRANRPASKSNFFLRVILWNSGGECHLMLRVSVRGLLGFLTEAQRHGASPVSKLSRFQIQFLRRVMLWNSGGECHLMLRVSVRGLFGFLTEAQRHGASPERQSSRFQIQFFRRVILWNSGGECCLMLRVSVRGLLGFLTESRFMRLPKTARRNAG